MVDLRGCEFVFPAAVLWCVVYPLLAKSRGTQSQVLVPTNFGVCTYLESLGVFDILKQGEVVVDDRGVPRKPDTKLVLPVSRFNSQSEVEDLANKALDNLMGRDLGAANLRSLVIEVFAELALNAVQHASSTIGAFGFIQFYQFEKGNRFICVVADGGIGIRRSLERNPALRDRVFYDWDAIELATRERVSGTGDPTRGIGLFGVSEDMRKPGRQLIITSGIGALAIEEDLLSRAWRTVLFPGTLAYASIPT
ncbi:MAG: hypothetical protein HYY32_03505 [Chloroflexi bacterium]|nr:hypothetical protein [Chloroflexota bacterium]